MDWPIVSRSVLLLFASLILVSGCALSAGETSNDQAVVGKPVVIVELNGTLAPAW